MTLEEIKSQFIESLEKAQDEKDLVSIEVGFLGRKGMLTEILRSLSDMSIVEKKRIGLASNELKDWILKEIETKKDQIRMSKWQELAEKEKIEINDLAKLQIIKNKVTSIKEGHLHPLSNFILKVCRVFEELGYEMVDGYEIETDYFNFTALNTPPDHPAKDDHDTFYVNDLVHPEKKDLLLRTQTSAMQVRYMLDHKPPVKIIVPGKTFRRDDDASHSPMFHQFEGLVVDEGITLGHLKKTLSDAMKKLLGEDTKIRFRNSYFPFVEPGLEVDVTCTICKGKGCNVCKGTGWLELLGAGMVHPQVLKNGGIDPEKYSGFAFGTGIERLAMMKHEIPSIKYLFENDIRFLKQF